MKRLITFLIMIILCSQIFPQTMSSDNNNVTKSLGSKKQYFGVFVSGITDCIGNKHIGFTQGYGGAIGITFTTIGILEADFIRFKGEGTNKEMLPDGTALDVWAFGFSGDFYIFSRHATGNPIRLN